MLHRSLLLSITLIGYNIAKAPLYYVRSGDIELHVNNLNYAGVNGFSWSSRSYSAGTNTYYLHFYAADVYPSYSNNRWFGFPLRWLTPSFRW